MLKAGVRVPFRMFLPPLYPPPKKKINLVPLNFVSLALFSSIWCIVLVVDKHMWIIWYIL